MDRVALQRVREEFEQEKIAIQERLAKQTRELMGDTPINLNSPEQVSQVIFSRSVNDKKEWVGLFEFTKDKKEFLSAVRENSTLIKKTKARE